VRIISGQWRGRPLVAPKGQLTRPTADRTRETLFSMLVSRLGSFEGLRVADLYAGSGALAFEAAVARRGARGAGRERPRRARRDQRQCGQTRRRRLDRASRHVRRRLPRQAPFDLIFADPPYEAGSGTAVAKAVAEAEWLSPGGWLAIETAKSDPVEAPPGLTIEATRTSAARA
jgi:16S rRNA (guanine966-N2)-methyltransferase